MPQFAIEVTTQMAPTEIYEQLGPDTPPEFEKETQVFVVVATFKNSINWLVLGEMNKDSQKFRDEIYVCASKAHNTLDRGCGKYYRGTNSVHVKRLHSDPFESMYNHNHYPLGGIKGADFDAQTTPEEVTPDEFRKHLIAFSEADKEMHNGTPRFLTKVNAIRIAEQFRQHYEQEMAEKEQMKQEEMKASINPLREYTDEDLKELREHQYEEQPCKAPEGVANTRGIGSERADERQPPEYSLKEYEYVLKFREEGKQRAQLVEDTVKKVREQIALAAQLNKAVENATPGSPVAIAANAFTQDVAKDIVIHAQKDAQVAITDQKVEVATNQKINEVHEYNTTLVELLKDVLKDLASKKPKTKVTLPGLHNLIEDTTQIQKDGMEALIKQHEVFLAKQPETMINFEAILTDYQIESSDAIPPQLVHKLRKMVSVIPPPMQNDFETQMEFYKA